MESPPALTTLLYLLMRDHLPTGKVRDLIERSLASGEGTVYTSKELELLARRYGADLLAELELPPAPPAPSTPAPTMRPHELPAKQASYYKALQALIEKDDWASVTEVVEATGLAVSTVRNNLRRAVGEGDAEGKGRTISRRYKATLEGKVGLEQSSAGDHDAPGEGVRPADTGDDAEVTGGGQESADCAQAPAAAKPLGKPARDGESDVELMARMSDYINESDAPVHPAELEGVFRVTRDRRQKIVKMLTERQRIRVGGAGPNVHYLPRKSKDTDYSPLAEDDTMGRPLHLQQPKRTPLPEALSAKDIERFKSWAQGQRTFKRRHASDAFPDLDYSVVSRLCTHLAAEGFLEGRGEGGESHYAVKNQVGATDSLGRHLDNDDSGTLEGRVMAELGDGGRTLEQLVARVSAPEEEIKRVLAKLIHESMATPNGNNGSLVYSPV